ncbi:Aconitate hydratase, mitochondrial [Frankliniella fusca]|uniref:Aconitate hydratase, mitochondrial n=1 Tax=Frankliniella fusca TaxID=407009 RepID=A0AAE1HXZ5_9NEOP|nr:Aconitate hydratase, mitochondrial [Frankliniella fusca]
MPPSKLPTVRQVLSVFFYELHSCNNVRDAARGTFNNVKALWSKTHVPRINDDKAIIKIESLYKEWRGIRRHQDDRPLTKKAEARRAAFEEGLDKLFDVSKKDADFILQYMESRASSEGDKKMYQEERLFFADQCGPRIGTSGAAESGDESESEFDADPDDPSYVGSPLKAKRGRRNLLTPEVVEAVDATGMSNRAVTKVLAAVSSSVGIPVAETNINERSIRRSRESQREDSAKNIMAFFEPDDILTLHWDGKIVPSLQGNSSQDRQAIVVTGVTTTQLLGAVPVPNGTAREIVNAVMGQLEAWKIKNNIRSVSFDTTSVNTGWKNGAAVGVERALGRDLIWLPCRHHVYERVLEDVYHEVMGPSLGPEVGIFRTLQKKWESIDKTQYITYATYAISRRALQGDREAIIKFCEEHITGSQPRDDYLEFLELTILFLGGIPSSGVRFRPPGPIHSARWMAKAIYSIKMCLFRKQLGLSTTDATHLLQVTIFIVKVYIRGWFLAPVSVSAPRNDLHFLKELILYEKVNSAVAKAAQNRFSAHLWYLSEELVGLSVFDEVLTDDDREKLVQGILSRESEDDAIKKRKLDMRDVPELEIGDLSTTSTITFFNTLGISTSFFQKPVSEWKNSDEYRHGLLITKHLRVVNDHAERAVKLMSDFNKCITTKEKSYQNLLLNVENHRKSLPDVKKETLVSKYDQ